MRTIRKIVILLSVILSAVAVKAQFAEDFRLWHHVSVVPYEDETFQVLGVAQGRFNDSGDYLGTYLFEIMGYVKATDQVKLGAGYDYFRIRGTENAPFVRVHMLNLDASYTQPLVDGLGFCGRHRLEVRWQDTRSDEVYAVSRLRLGIRVATPSLAPLAAVSMVTEPFYDYDRGAVMENRFQPLVLDFAVADGMGFQIYGMLHSIKGIGRDWETSYVLETGVHFSLQTFDALGMPLMRR